MILSEEFLCLLRLSLRQARGPEILFRAGETVWQGIVTISKEQNVTGLVGDAVSSLPEGIEVPEEAFLYFVAEKEKTAMQGRRMAATASSVVHHFQEAGLHPLVMKGPATSRFYPKPELRSYGDIDLYFRQEEFGRVRDLVRSESGFMLAGDGSFHIKWDGVDVDVHDKYYDLHRPENSLPEVPSPEATLLMLSAHAMKHACGTGVGMRQICDYAMACRALEGRYDPQHMLEIFKKSGLGRWNDLLASFISRRLEMEVPHSKVVPDSPLLRIVEEGGNFGHHASGRERALGKSEAGRKADTVKRFLNRLPFSLKYAPGETLRTVASLSVGNFKKNA